MVKSATRWRPTGRTLGQGGQAQVVVVTDSAEEFEGELALKLLTNRNRVGRLDLEISTTKSLWRSGAPVMEVLDDYIASEPEASRPWYVMPIADGGHLKAEEGVAQDAAQIEERLALFGKIVTSVRSIHDHGVAHRDLKPANILIHKKELLLCDLGLCLPLSAPEGSDRLTGELERIGSLHYTPKEAFGSGALNRTQFAYDAYALGKILYEVMSGRILPGFTSPNNPNYDLYLQRGGAIFAALNSVLRGLLADDPAARMKVLDRLPAKIDELIVWSQETAAHEVNPEYEFRDQLSAASETLARLQVDSSSVPVSGSTEATAELSDQLYKTLIESPLMDQIREILVFANDELLELQQVANAARLRELVGGAFVKSHHGLEPLEDQGFPRRGDTETGCSVGVVPKGETAKSFPQVWMGCLVSAKRDQLYVAIGIAVREAGVNGYADLIDGSVVIAGEVDDPAVIRDALNSLKALIPRFAKAVTSAYTRAEVGESHGSN